MFRLPATDAGQDGTVKSIRLCRISLTVGTGGKANIETLGPGREVRNP